MAKPSQPNSGILVSNCSAQPSVLILEEGVSTIFARVTWALLCVITHGAIGDSIVPLGKSFSCRDKLAFTVTRLTPKGPVIFDVQSGMIDDEDIELLRTLWEKAYGTDQTDRLLKEIEKKGVTDRKGRRRIEAIKDAGTHLRALLRLLKEELHPTEFFITVKLFGMLKDALRNGVKGRAKSVAKRLRKKLRRYPPEPYIDLLKNEIPLKVRTSLRIEIAQNYLEHEYLTSYELHALRKEIRAILIYLDRMAIKRRRAAGEELIKRLSQVDTDLSQINKGFVEQKLEGGPPLKKQRVKMPEDVRRHVTLLLELIELD